ncbi:MAG: mobilization protein, partial [Alkalinema sp. RL_2_19]|nr:mobilization protein [Alkalinema sp. RL_2_19]
MVTSPKKQAAEGKSSAVERAKSRKRYIHLADGNKGGVGKSVLARTLYAVLLDLGTPVLGVETDIDSPDFKGIYTDVQVSCFSEDEKANEQACSIINWAIEDEKNIVVNLPATVHKAFQLWVEQFDIIDLAASHDVGLVKWFICTGEYDSMKSLQVSLEAFGEKIPHVVVKNLK